MPETELEYEITCEFHTGVRMSINFMAKSRLSLETLTVIGIQHLFMRGSQDIFVLTEVKNCKIKYAKKK